MDTKAIIDTLVSAYRKADDSFASAQAGPREHLSFELARIIGNLQGTISLVTIELGMREAIRLPKIEVSA